MTENVIYSNVRVDRPSFMFYIELATNNSQHEQSIFFDIEKDLSFWMQNASDKLLEIIKKFKKENKNLIEEYNEHVNVIDNFLAKKREYLVKKRTLQNENKTLQKQNASLQNELIDQKFALRIMRQRLEILNIVNDRIRNVKKSITSSYILSVNHIAEMTADIDATDWLEKIKRSIVIFDSTIFIENKTKFKHWLSTIQSKLKSNENWYLIERMIMIYVNINLNDETYKHIAARLDKNFFRRCLIIDEIFDDFKRVYIDSNKMQTIMNIFTQLTQINKYAKFHVFWNEFQRFMKRWIY